MALTRDQIIRAAIAVVDAEGIEALTMRRLGRELGVEAMSLYHHIHNKEELLDAVHEALLARIPPVGDGEWPDLVRGQAHAFRALLAAHPNAVPLLATRAAQAPGALARVDESLAVLRRAGFDEPTAEAAFQTAFVFVVGHAMFHLAGRADTAEARAEFAWGLEVLVDGLRARAGASPDESRGRR